MEDRWLAFGKAELGVEQQQLEDEGAALSASLQAELEALLAAETPAPERVRRFMERSAALRPRKARCGEGSQQRRAPGDAIHGRSFVPAGA